MVTHRESRILRDTYALYNRRYFGNKLPADVTCIWLDAGPLGRWDSDINRIAINRKLKPWSKVWKETLLHEMAHVATDDEREGHGPRWRKEMLRLARIGAFDNLW